MKNAPFACGKLGQAGVEQMVIMFMLFVMLVVISTFASISYLDTARTERASEAARKIASAADTIYAMQPGTKIFMPVTLPDGITLTNLSESEILIRIETSAGETDILENPKARVTGNLPTGAGVYNLELEVLDSNVVNITAVNATA